MDIRILKQFVAVCEELNITRAAEKLHMSQPPLSSQIKALEDELNTTLFVRGKRRLNLTESGQLLYRRAKEIIDLSEKAKTEIISMSKGLTGTISIGLVEGMVPDIAAKWFSGFLENNNEIKYRILDGNSDDLIEDLRSGIINLAIITPPYDQNLLNSFEIGKEKIMILMSKGYSLKFPNEKITIKELENVPLIIPRRNAIKERIYGWFKDNDIEPTIVCEMDSYLDASALALRGVGVTIYPKTEYIPNDSLIKRDLDITDNDMEYLFTWIKGRPLPKVEEEFIEYVKKDLNK